MSGPAIPSRFFLRVKALLGERLLEQHREREAVEWARTLDDAPPVPPYARPKPLPDAQQRKVAVSVSALDRLRSDPYQFYAGAILGLRRLDRLDEEPSAAWKGTMVHALLERWHEKGGSLKAIAETMLAETNAHPLMVSLWLPRLLKGLEWVERTIAGFDGREVAVWEKKGEFLFDGVRIHGRADRIDRLADGTLAIVDYKTGSPPSGKRVEAGFSLQLGLIGLMAREGGFDGLAGEPSRFEYWSLARKGDDFGYIASPVKDGRNRAKLEAADFVDHTADFLEDALNRWINGTEPFTARLNPDLDVYSDYDQLMRLDEWMGREEGGGA